MAAKGGAGRRRRRGRAGAARVGAGARLTARARAATTTGVDDGDGNGGGGRRRRGSLAAMMCSASLGGNWRGMSKISEVWTYIAKPLVPVRGTNRD